MLTLKFGGTSMGSAKRILNSADIIIDRAGKDRVSVVVSAVAGVSNMLADSINDCCSGADAKTYVASVKKIHAAVCSDIGKSCENFDAAAVLKSLQCLFDDYEKMLNAVSAFGECPLSVHCRIMGLGELLSSPIMEAVLKAKKQKVTLLDSRKLIFTTGLQQEGDPDYKKTMEAFAPYLDGEEAAHARILLFPGFVCTWEDGQTGLLGRNGSDFSAAIVAVGLRASRVEFWTDVDGIFTADPRIVSDAILVDDMSYEEAMELSFFGSKVLYPKTLAPLSARGIEAWSLNSHNPSSRGTRIGVGPFPSSGAVRGITCLKNTAMISVSGSGLKDKHGIAARIFAAVARSGISMLLITQSSSEYTISFCVKQIYASKVVNALNGEFEYEIRTGDVNTVEITDNCAIVSIVGDGMKEKRGVAGTFFNALASHDINILAIAQGSSERSISTVINGSDGDTAVRVAHRFFFNTAQTVEVFLFGTGTIGGCLLEQIKARQKSLAEQHIDIRVMGIASADGMMLDEKGIDLHSWKRVFAKNAQPTSVDEMLSFASRIKPLNPVFVDCTASSDLPLRYTDIFKAGMHIATPNKRANSMDMAFYKNLRSVANLMHRRFLYETNVGAGLPVMDTLQNLIKSGDKLVRFSGIMSGSLSYIFGRLDEGVPFSKAVLEAKKKGFTEPDPRDDLAGADAARKVLIIAREAGIACELSDIKTDRIFPADFDESGTVEEFLQKLPELDAFFAEKRAALKKEGKVLRMGGSIENGECRVGLVEADSTNPLYNIRDGENAFVFLTERYTPIPLTVHGYGAGAEVTAAGVFGDILRTVSWNPEV
ncbi:bifunctional aspartate kinase/homoserine dehydrogenase I [Treponema sp. OMZ 840]|uniref:bifunctional aspartate kinase/homoserine dehydrogenase I n=1 Tax=Treponema sp. OMZ 840 TaxID=244313 RepID=UPI003D944DB4